MTREEIEQLDDTEPYCFETDREEWWYNVGLKEGLETADQNPRKGLWDAEKVCNFLSNIDIQIYISSLTDGVGFVNIHIGDIIEDMKKAMED